MQFFFCLILKLHNKNCIYQRVPFKEIIFHTQPNLTQHRYTTMLSKMKFTNQRGAAAVEFAIVLPILLLLFAGVTEFGIMYYNKQVLTNASREGARAGVDPALS